MQLHFLANNANETIERRLHFGVAPHKLGQQPQPTAKRKIQNINRKCNWWSCSSSASRTGARHTSCQRQVVERMLETGGFARTRSAHEYQALVAPRLNQAPVGGLGQRVDVGRHVLRLAAAEHGDNLRTGEPINNALRCRSGCQTSYHLPSRSRGTAVPWD